MTPTPPIGSVAGIESLIIFALQIFTQVFSLFNQHGVPISAAPGIIQTLHATPNITEVHKTIITAAVSGAMAAHQATAA